MENKKVKNVTESDCPSCDEFKDEDIIHDLLTCLKHLNTSYGTLIQEASHEAFSNDVDQMSKKIGKLARDAFNIMFEKGWYTLEEESESKLQTEYDKHSAKFEKINE